MTKSANLTDSFYNLTPDHVLEGVEDAGFSPTGRYIQLNSYENRVFDIFLDPDLNPKRLNERLIAKFYRPLRWSEQAILDEHNFLAELNSNGIPAVAPLQQQNGTSLSVSHHIYMAVFEKAFGRMPEELYLDDLKRIGRTLARIHNVGEQRIAKHRPTMNAETYGWPILDLLEDWVSPEVWGRYEKAAEAILSHLDEVLDESSFIRIHGDCHRGNLLLTDVAGEEPEFFFVDFDDFCNGPPAQDFWMLFSGDSQFQADEQDSILSGYEELRHLDPAQLKLMEPLRGLRILHYAGWIARRWKDPSFPKLFPNFQEYSYWAEEAEALERIAWAL